MSDKIFGKNIHVVEMKPINVEYGRYATDSGVTKVLMNDEHGKEQAVDAIVLRQRDENGQLQSNVYLPMEINGPSADEFLASSEGPEFLDKLEALKGIVMKRYVARTRTRPLEHPDPIEHTFLTRIRPQGDIDVINEVFVHDTYELIQADIQPKVIFDIGAHIGTFTVLAKILWPDATVYCFEPNPVSFYLLKQNTKVFDKVHCFNMAVTYTQGAVLTDGRGATGGGFMTTQEQFAVEAAGKTEKDGFLYSILTEGVETITLEDIFEGYDIDHVDLAKFDCEGGEINCFQNMELETARKFRDIIGEYHIEGGYKAFLDVARRCFPDHGANGRNEAQPIGGFWLMAPKADE